MTLRRIALATCLAAVSLAAYPAAAVTNIVQNPGFEDPDGAASDAAYWTESSVFRSDVAGGHTGVASAATICIGPQAVAICTISQTLNTTAGASYDLSFWARNTVAFNPGEQQFAIYWNGVSLGTVDFDETRWTKITYSGLIATGSSTTLALGGRNDPGGLYFDDVSVTAAIPEPGAWALMIAGFGAAGASLRRRRMASAQT
jgi:hypothetical protein